MSDRPPERVDSQEDKKTCWVCFATEEDDRTAAWSRPCRCRGTSKYVHQQCLQRWIDEKQKGNVTTKVSCPQCNTEYLIDFPKLGRFVQLLDLADRIVIKVCPLFAGGVLIGGLYWTLVTYGAVSVMQVLGHKEGLNVMENADPLSLLLGLPAIPITLILAKMINWEDFVLRLWRRHLPRMLKYFGRKETEPHRVPAEVATNSLSEPFNLMRVLCGAIIMPTTATVTGKLLFSQVTSNFQRTLLGGTAFLAIKGVMKLFLKQQQYNRQSHRKIRDFDEATAAEKQQS